MCGQTQRHTGVCLLFESTSQESLPCLALSFLLLVVAAFTGCSRKPPNPEPPPPNVVVVPDPDDGKMPPPRVVTKRPPREALTAGVAYLLGEQSDGRGVAVRRVRRRSRTAPPSRRSPCVALQDAHRRRATRTPESRSAIQKGCNVPDEVREGRSAHRPRPDGFDYPIYTASLTSRRSRTPSARELRRGPRRVGEVPQGAATHGEARLEARGEAVRRVGLLPRDPEEARAEHLRPAADRVEPVGDGRSPSTP